MNPIITRNNVSVLGNGAQCMMMAHGFGCDQNTWRYISQAFQQDYKIVLFDYIGAGKSDLSAYNKEKYSSLAGYAQDVLDICKALSLQKVIFIGHSVSCMIGVLASLRAPSLFSHLIFIGPSPCYINDKQYHGGMEVEELTELLEVMDDNYLGWSASLAPAIMGNSNQPELGESLTNSFCATNPDIAKRFAKVTFWSDNRDSLPKVSVRNLTLQCSEDIIAPVQVGEYINENTPGNELVLLKASGHCTHLSAPDEIIEEIKKYLSKYPE